MPKMSNTMTEGRIVKWLKAEGESVKKGEALLEIMTDKVNMEVEAPEGGVLGKILYDEAEGLIGIGAAIGIICEQGEKIPDKYLNVSKIVEAKEEIPAPDNTLKDANTKDIQRKDKGVRVSPRARKLAKEKGIDIAQVKPAGDSNVIQEEDILEFIRHQPRVSPLAQKMADDMNISLVGIQGSGTARRIMKQDIMPMKEQSAIAGIPDDGYTSTKLSGIRLVIAERMSESKFNAPHVYFCKEVDMQNCMDFREKVNGKAKEFGVKVSFTNIIAAAVTRALIKYPQLNSCISDKEVRTYNNCHIAVAVDTDRGLVVPVLKYTNRKTLLSLSKEMNEMIEKARENKLSPEQLNGGTFTISNLGALGADFFTAIINPPQVAILAVASIVDRPVAVSKEITVKPMMNMVLSVDHRVVDGALAMRFLNEVQQYLQKPELLSL